MRTFFVTTLLILVGFTSFADKNPDPRSNRKSVQAVKISTSPKINAMADDSVWHNIPAITDFVQYQPVYNAPPSYRTEVKIAYDNYAIYVLAHMFDPNPDSISRQLGLRDANNLNADMFSIEFDTYNNQLDAYTFRVSASGVQFDQRESDVTYDAVWESDVKITRDGWVAEMKIPYSALRFARINPQIWGMEMTRTIRRNRESDQWSLESLEAKNDLPYWGVLEGLNNIKPPVRLSATPYIVLQAQHYPEQSSGKDISSSFGGGMDMKYGINESFTLDMSLLPDFSQVQSDNKVKNLTAFETVYSEQRPFFKEAVDLFMKGDIFYSRRIGKTPTLFYSVEDSLKEGESISKNPVQQRLVNATKVSGRNKKGLAIGVLNAVTANTYATLSDVENNQRKVLTDPATNYNLLVFDQALKNNSNVYITNTNVIRGSNFRDANVTASGITLNDKSNTYRFSLSGGMSQVFMPAEAENQRSTVRGFKYGISASKTNGNLQWSVSRGTLDDKFNANDMGLTIYNNYNNNSAAVSYSIYKPFWVLRDISGSISLSNQNNFTTHKPQTANLKYNFSLTTMKYLSMWGGIGHALVETYDYYEPRTEGMYYMRAKSTWGNYSISTDYRKPFALDASVSAYYAARDGSKGFGTELNPLLRLNNKVTFSFSFGYDREINDYGYVNNQDANVIFGNRDIHIFENGASGKYLFKNNVSLSLMARHYYSQGKYSSFYTLLDNGYLTPNDSYQENHDFIFSTFNVDMIFSWIFAPGSSMNIVWKNEITGEKDHVTGNYYNNFDDTFREPQLNNISLKLLYYIDYQRLSNNKS